MVLDDRMTVKKASTVLGMAFSTAKQIVRKYRLTGRLRRMRKSSAKIIKYIPPLSLVKRSGKDRKLIVTI